MTLPPKSADWLSRKQAASFLATLGCPITPRTLEKLAGNNNAGKGPAFTRFRWKSVRYARTDLEAWAKKEATRIE